MPFRCFGTISADPATALLPDHGLQPGAAPAPVATAEALIDGRSEQGQAAHVASRDPGARPALDAGASIRQRLSPSFQIRGAAPAPGGPPGWSTLQPRLDRINSAELLRLARTAYFGWLSGGGSSGGDPLGVVLAASGSGRVAFELPVLLPGEQFVPIEWLRPRSQGRPRSARAAGIARPPA